MNYRLSNVAQEDLLEASRYYDLQRAGLGAEFLVEVGIGVARILDAPESWPQIEPGVRKYRLDRFPFGILYRTRDRAVVEVVAIFDLRRRPGSWRR